MTSPNVTIGLPVHDGETHVSSAIDALLSQDFGDFELVISDNASGDRTAAICQGFAARDGRIRYIRQPSNVGAVRNFEIVFEAGRSRFFAWAAHDDQWSPEFLGRCVTALTREPDAVLAIPRVRHLDPAGTEVPILGDVDPNAEWNGLGESARIRRLVSTAGGMPMYGLMRRDALAAQMPLSTAWGADILCLLGLCLSGPFITVPETLFAYRVFPHKTIESLGSAAFAQYGFTTRALPHAALLVDLLVAAWSAPARPWRRAWRALQVAAGLFAGTQWLRRCIAIETVAALRAARGRHAWAAPPRLAPWVLVATPEVVAAINASNTRHLIRHYRQRRLIRFALRLPLYTITHLPVLFRAETWKAVSRLATGRSTP